MPLHDWKSVPDNVFHSFHLGLCWNLAWILNDGVLPAGYEARAEESLGVAQSDVLLVEPAEGAGADAPEDDAAATAPGGEEAGQPVLTLVAPLRQASRRQRRVAVYSAADDRRVAVVEVVSRGNRDSRKRAGELRDKLLGCLESGLQVALIDLWPPAGAGWADVVAAVVTSLDPTASPPPSLGHYVASFACAREEEELELRLYLEALAVGRPLPEFHLFLAPAQSVAVPLERAYEETVAKMPPSGRRLLG